MTPRERLTRLAEILEARPAVDPHFNIEIYSCGSSACALGWGARDPVLNAEGLILRGLSRNATYPPGDTTAAVVRVSNDRSFEEFFGLNRHGPVREGDPLGNDYTNEVWWLFHPPTYSPKPGPHDVARRIRQILSEKTT